MAEISNMFNKNRMNLGEKIPLDTPLVIQLEASGFCNLESCFCPCGNDDTRKLMPQDIMDEESFDLFIKQCLEFPQAIKVLRFIGIGEPLVNPKIVNFVKKAKESKAFERVEITSNGLLLTKELSDELIRAGLDVLLVSLESTDERRFKKIANRNVDLGKLKENLQYFYYHENESKLYIKTTDLGVENKEEFYKEYGPFCDYIYVEKIIENWPEFLAGATEGAVRYQIDEYQKSKKVCIQPFKLLCLAANGDVMPCSVDWKRILKLGNIKEESLLSIWNGDRRKNLLLSLLKDEKCPFCSHCNYNVQNQPDDIDDYIDKIIRRLG